MLETSTFLDYQRDGACVVASDLLPPGEDIPPFEDEQIKPSMLWENWETGFTQLDIAGLTYNGCRFAVNYYLYACRGDRAQPQNSRSQAVVSEWVVNDDVALSEIGYVSSQAARIFAFFPVYDGIGFWIGKRRREEKVNHYSPNALTAIAQASAQVMTEIDAPRTPDEASLVYKCIWAPGKAFADDGTLIPGSTTTALRNIGLQAREVVKTNREGDKPLYFRLFGSAALLMSDDTEQLPFHTELAELLHPAWKYVNQLPNDEDPPDPESY